MRWSVQHHAETLNLLKSCCLPSNLLLLLLPSNESPAGIDNGARLRVKGEGNAGRRGAPPGDLIVFIRVKDHPELRREGIDIHSDIEISYVDAILGSLVSCLGLCHVDKGLPAAAL
jgi:hypothetical protein